MGYSCAAKAGLVLDAIVRITERASDPTSDGMSGGGFYNSLPGGRWWERGRENGDGAITGTIWGMRPDGQHCFRIGGFKITAEGRITQFPGLTKEQKAEAMEEGAAEYRRRYEVQERPGGVVHGLEWALSHRPSL